MDCKLKGVLLLMRVKLVARRSELCKEIIFRSVVVFINPLKHEFNINNI
jgi:hypothetical protein